MDNRNALFADIQAYIDQLLLESDAQNPAWNIEKIRAGTPNKWNYIDGCMIIAVLALYEITSDEKYLNFADSFMDWFVQKDGTIRTYDPLEYNLDNINPGKVLFTLYTLTGKEKYRRGIDTVYNQLIHSPRTKEGSFWHKNIYPNQVWLDGLYMAQPFYMAYETRFNSMRNYMDCVQQFLIARKRMRDEKSGLYYHGYDESREMFWANPETGCSQHFWSRALGWFVVALCDTAEQIDEQLYYEYRQLCAMLHELVDAVLVHQQKDGMFYQIIDHPDAQGNYLETSGTALFAYAILKAVRLGILPERYRAVGERAFFGTAERYLRKNPDGSLVLGGICLVAGLGGPQKRDGSLAYYFSEPIVENESKGVAPFLLAYTELLRTQQQDAAYQVALKHYQEGLHC